MKIILANEKEVTVTRASLNYNYENASYQLTLSFPLSVEMEDVVEGFTPEAVSKIIIRRDGYKDKVLEGFSINGINEDISDSAMYGMSGVTMSLTKTKAV